MLRFLKNLDRLRDTHAELMMWLRENRPAIAAEVGPMAMWDGAQILMRETGVQLSPSDEIAAAEEKLLAAFKSQHQG